MFNRSVDVCHDVKCVYTRRACAALPYHVMFSHARSLIAEITRDRGCEDLPNVWLWPSVPNACTLYIAGTLQKRVITLITQL